MFSRSTLSIMAAILLGATVEAHATDYYSNGMKDGIQDEAIDTILVPQAVEMPETFAWYLRGDFGYNFSSTTDINTTAPGVFEPDAISSGSIGFGRLLGPNLRFDITADWRNDDDVYSRSGTAIESFSRPGTVTIPDVINGGSVDVQDVITFNVETNGQETVTFQNHTVMANLYYDLDGWRGFRPYVGGGLGMAIYQIASNRTSTYVRCDATAPAAEDPLTNPNGDLANCDITQEDINRAGEDRSESSTAFGWAVSATAGASYEISTGMKLDMNYRLTYSAANAVVAVGGVGQSIGIEDKFDQELRFGVRYELY